MKYTKKSGFTLIELLLVIAITAIVAAATTPFLSRFLLQTQFDTTVDKLVAAVRKAQSEAMGAQGTTVWGVCLTGSVVRVFEGSCGSPVQNTDFTLPASITITGLTTVTFSQRGEPSAATTLTIQSAILSQNLSINTAGGIVL